jgi:hypothetical protein
MLSVKTAQATTHQFIIKKEKISWIKKSKQVPVKPLPH